jgi:hypothetical protein
MHPRHLDDECKEVVNEGVQTLVDHSAPGHVRDGLELHEMK